MNSANFWQVNQTRINLPVINNQLKLNLFLLSAFTDYSPFSTCNTSWLLSYSRLSSLVSWSMSFNRGRTKRRLGEMRKFSIKDETYPLTPLNTPIQYKNRNSQWSLFLHNWETFRPKSTFIYSTNREFRLMFLSASAVKVTSNLVSAKRYFSRWLDSYNLLFNLFYSESQFQLFTNKLFIEESLVFNWNYNYRHYKLFKHLQPFFMFKDAPHGGYIHSAMQNLLSERLDAAIIVDLQNHKRLLTYIQKYNLFSLGLVPHNYMPWVVSYPIPSFADSPVTQYYFLRLLFYIRSSAQITRHTNLTKNFSRS